jgi:hypothetical protein
MQEGNLKTVSYQKSKEKLKWYQRANPMRYMPWVLYKNFLDSYIGFKGIETYYYYHTYPEVIDFPLFSAIKVKELPKERAKTEAIDLKSMEKLSYSLDLSSRTPKVQSGLEFDRKVKWIVLNFKRLVKTKAANIKLLRTPKIKTFRNFNLQSRLKSKEVAKERILIKNFVSSREELLEMTPYIDYCPKENLCAVPIEKEPMNKNFIDLQLLEKFKQKLSEIAMVRPAETKIISVYENMHLELYKDIEHNTKKNTILCYLDENKRHIRNPKNFYLIFGQRLADKKMFTIISEG